MALSEPGSCHLRLVGPEENVITYDLDVANRCERSPDEHCPGSDSTIGQHDGAGMRAVAIYPAVDRLEQVDVRVIVGAGETIVAARVAMHLYDGQVVFGSFAEEPLNERRGPVDSVSAALARLVGHAMEPVNKQDFRPKRCCSAAECNCHRLLPVAWEEMLAQVGVLLTCQTEPDIAHPAHLSSRSSHSSTRRTCVSMQS